MTAGHLEPLAEPPGYLDEVVGAGQRGFSRPGTVRERVSDGAMPAMSGMAAVTRGFRVAPL